GWAETTQSIASGNGSITATVTYTSQPPGIMWFGLINGTFTGNAAEIDYGWKYYDNGVAIPAINGELPTNYIVAANNETLEVRINGSSVEWYRGSSSTPVYSVSGQALSYPYRGAATLSASGNRMLNVRMTGVTAPPPSPEVTWTSLFHASVSGSSWTPPTAPGGASRYR